MSERAAMAGDNLPDRTIEHKGRVFTFRAVITEGVMLAVEEALFDKEVKALQKMCSLYSSDEYSHKLDELRDRYTNGHFAFESSRTTAYLKTQHGAVLLMKCMSNCTFEDIVMLMAERREDFEHCMKTALTLSMPQGLGHPKVNGRRDKRRHR